MKRVLFIALLFFPVLFVPAQNLIVNPGAELDPITNGWTQIEDPLISKWKSGTEVTPHSGSYHFYAGNNSPDGSELYQDIDVSAFASSIDAGSSIFNFSTWMRIFNISGGIFNDQGRVYVEYRDASALVLSTFDTGLRSQLSWTQVSDARVAPVGTRIIRIRLSSTKLKGTAADGYFDDLILTHTISTLPVSLISFTSRLEENNIDIQWQTSAEESNDYFTLEKSEDGVNWNVISIQKGLLQSNQVSTYQFTDPQLAEGIHYYRLTQTDVDGTSASYPIIAQKIGLDASLDFSFYPNPCNDAVTINSAAQGNKRIRIFSTGAQTLLTEVSFDTNEYQIDLTEFPSGHYVIELMTSDAIERKVLVKY